ncbi:putative 3-oxoacyl-[acyl-carrier-protein] synthase, mitochondrial [Candida viswanathii]|uniref:3-oxoacyl-[acyl-carrier-protein] synthase n=1 Tax=Candida viswanathii TaxID=5486 RepID=A0A367XW33_9ASCO|nr:putative 3-oxoacyl-[acyl-carrier-protein] synthase, mitochondrial [Candida viswanathii]
MGIVSPLGVGLKRNWQQLIAGKSGIISTTTLPDYETAGWSQVPSKVIGKVPEGPLEEGGWRVDDHIPASESRRMATFSHYALASTQEALSNAKLLDQETNKLKVQDLTRVGVAVGSGIGSFEDSYNNSVAFESKGYRKVQPLFIPKLLNNMAAGNISIKYETQGPLHSVSTACATGLQAIGDAFNFMKLGYSDVMICGGTESSIHPLALAGFARARSVVTDFNDDPTKASRPFDKSRNGFVLSEGSGIVILETLEHAFGRGLTSDDIYAEVLGYGVSGDAYHITAPREDGSGAYNAMSQAIDRSGIQSEQVDYVNAHATSTVIGDRAENNAMMRLFNPERTKVSSTKSSVGHLLGAAGAVESIFTINAIKTGEIPPTLNLDNVGQHENDDASQFKFDYVPNKSITMDVQYGLCNSFGFGGVNSSLCFGKYTPR